MATARAKGLIFEDWLRDRCVRQADVSTLHAALYRDYCKHAGQAAMGAQAFARAMEGAGIRVLKLSGGQYRKGVRLKVIADVVVTADTTNEEIVAATGTDFRHKLQAVLGRRPEEARLTGGAGVDEIEVTLDLAATQINYRSPPLVRLTPITPGDEPPEIGLMLEIAGEGDEASARIAHELFAERQRQKSAEGWDAAHDDEYRNGELQRAAAAYAYGAAVKPGDSNWLRTDVKLPRPPAMYHTLETLRSLWPWSFEWWKPGDPRRMLVKAGSLIIAAIEAIDRKRAQERGRP